MKIDANKLSIATMVIFSVAWVLCSALVAFFPAGMMSLSGYMVHANLSEVTWSLTATGFLIGLIAWALMSGLIVWLVAMLYNTLKS